MKCIFITIITLSILPIAFSQTASYSLTYRFVDSPDREEAQRCYTIQVDDTQVELTIDISGNVLLHEIYPMQHTTYDDFLQKIIACHLTPTEMKSGSKKCLGGTTDLFTIKFPEPNKIITGKVYHCEDKDYANLKGNVEDARNYFVEMVPNLEVKLSSTEH